MLYTDSMKKTHIIAVIVTVCILIGLLIYFRTREKDETSTETATMNVCPQGFDTINGVCASPCSDMYDTQGKTCIEKCLDGEIEAGDSCRSITGTSRKKKTYSRIPEVVATPPAECEEGYEGTFADQLCFQSCSSNNYVNFLHMCAEPCPADTREIGAMCVSADGNMTIRKTYIPHYTWSKHMKEQGASNKALPCQKGTETHPDVLCVDVCPSGYTTQGGLCIEDCQDGETDIGTACLKGIVTRLKTVKIPSYNPVSVKK